ncbi:hypothetical protein M231_03077 [Tremella mesenterica]|uniref:Uncharacterized protein n=1 Tax=Tremella mesenterica TaxID=5217 RepID=A0A4Q1BNW2_TREME|nr:uncharacterized protein TREMEDRAFT_63034 [Tremella mesenterica DSM 1558]EIW68568.1 hypothetical protein TREMEDRAFT_63034 [Tremella mesenterica DSM 1558]RXK39575.1 hypothetical protein M231_03077 [Tremella mesenterica]
MSDEETSNSEVEDGRSEVATIVGSLVETESKDRGTHDDEEVSEIHVGSSVSVLLISTDHSNDSDDPTASLPQETVDKLVGITSDLNLLIFLLHVSVNVTDAIFTHIETSVIGLLTSLSQLPEEVQEFFDTCSEEIHNLSTESRIVTLKTWQIRSCVILSIHNSRVMPEPPLPKQYIKECKLVDDQLRSMPIRST